MDLVLAVLVGFVSALVPVVNAEAYLVARIGLGAVAPASAIGLAVGQTAGKALLVEATRRGSRSRVVRQARARRRGARGPAARGRSRWQQWSEDALRRLDDPCWSGPVVGLAASVGVPPLALVAVVFGLRNQPLRVFLPWCLAGRLLRFIAIGAGMGAAT